jgi:RNA polymerase sigma factor (sigma-70 family)
MRVGMTVPVLERNGRDSMSSMARATSLTTESWEALFDFLDPGRQLKSGPNRDMDAEARYQEITRKLICFFASRGCHEPEDLAMETILRVAAKCAEIVTAGYSDRTGYFYGVARNLFHEWLRDSQRESRTRDALRREPVHTALQLPPGEGETAHRCLDLCVAKLTERARRLIGSYYSANTASKIECHRQLAIEFGKSVNAVRIEVHRIRKLLRTCVIACAHPQSRRPPRWSSF